MGTGNRCIENLQVWNDARKFVVDIYLLMKDNRDYGFKDQIQRAAVSIMNNIAEGFEYNSDSQFVKFLKISLGSCSEVKSMLYLCSDLGFCTEEKRTRLHEDLIRITSKLHKLIIYLQNKKTQ